MKLNINSVLFLGVGGISMHQLALAFKSLGVKVYGYDAKESKYTDLCAQNGIEITTKFKMEYCDVDLCVVTGAIKNNKYLTILKKRGVTIVDRAEVLGWLCKQFKTVIAVAGTHGKSTTASLIYEILRIAGKKVSCHIGADVFAPRFNLGDDYLIVEACEYNKSFLSIYPNIAVVTNVEPEHMDSYSSLFNLRSAFLTFIKRSDKRYIFNCSSTKFITKVKNVDIVDKCNFNFKPKIKGVYNLNNIALAARVAQDLGVNSSAIIKAVNSFNGVPRRYEYIGNVNSTKIYIDYAHHPTEIEAFVKTFREEYKNSLIVFQPHTYSRTKTFLKQFVSIFASLHNLIIYKEYAAREKPELGISAKELFNIIKEKNQGVLYFANAKKFLEKLSTFDAVAFVGAGDINLVAESLIKVNKK